MESILGRYLVINKSLHEDIIKRKYMFFSSEGPLNIIGPISKINLIIGANNSGKSNFMRGLFKSNIFPFTTYNEEIVIDVKSIASLLLDKVYPIFDNTSEINLDFLSKQNIPNAFKNELEPFFELSKKNTYSNIINKTWLKNIGDSLNNYFLNGGYENLKFDLSIILYNLKLLNKILNIFYYTKNKNGSFHNFSYKIVSVNIEIFDLIDITCSNVYSSAT